MTNVPQIPTLLLVGGAGPAPAGIDVAVMTLEQARARGLRIHMTNQEPALAQTAPACDMAHRVSVVDFENTQASVAWAQECLSQGERFDIVFSNRELAIGATTEIATAIGAPGNNRDAVRRIRTKDACRTWLAAAGFPQPPMRLCRDIEQAWAFVQESTGPWVVKPRDRAGSEGVSMVSDPAQLPAAISLLPDQAQPFLIEEYVEGPEFSADGIFLDGRPEVLAITAKEKTPPPFFVEIGHSLPADLPEETRREIEETMTKALVALELRFGVFHAEFWLTARGVVLGEVHVRLGGGYIHRLLAHAIPGLEMFGLIFDDAISRPRGPRRFECVRAAASRYFVPPPGRLVGIEGWEEMTSHPAVVFAEMNLQPGDVINPMRSSDDRIGPIIVGARTATEARNLARQLAETVRFIVEPG